MMRLVARDLLDPRSTLDAIANPIPGSVNIPFDDLPARVLELPPRDIPTRVVGPSGLVRATIEWLVAHGRRGISADMPGGHESDVQPSSGVSSRQNLPAAPAELGRLWRPNAFLEQACETLAPGTALDIACGSGRDAVFLAAAGWRATGVDILPDALEMARDLERRYAPGCSAVDWRVVNVEDRADGARLGGPFNLVTCFRFLHRPLLAQVDRLLLPGGIFLMETFTTLHRERHGKPRNNVFLLQPGELPGLLTSLKLVSYDEAWRGDTHTARAWAVAR